ncbi:MAG: type II toxin-antitoxin system VapC family toxin [Cytophagales bacterium]|nr:type II toxin-antitoxin system VapC family toxin [Cytophagales bacterium]
MKLLDSNILIYSAEKKYSFLRKIFKEQNIFISEITKLEVLGYHKITAKQKKYFGAVFNIINTKHVSSKIIEEAIVLRQSKNLSVCDSIIAATSKINDYTIYTNNTKDFEHIPEIKLFNPLTMNNYKEEIS